jgi:hypothetical protein
MYDKGVRNDRGQFKTLLRRLLCEVIKTAMG